MSMVITLSTYDGIVLASDSRLLFGNRGMYDDDSQEIYIMNHKICIALTGHAVSKAGVDFGDAIREYIMKNNYKENISDVVRDFYEELGPLSRNKSRFKDFNDALNIIGYSGNRTPQSILIEADTCPPKLAPVFDSFLRINHPGKEGEDVTEYVKSIMEQYEENAGEIGVEKAIELCQTWIDEASELHRGIGGEVDIIQMTKDKTRWIKDKRNRHKRLSQKLSKRIMGR
ncbi:MAG: hypothetical protein Q8930_13180 [Bacillota bacterium]|nr:hypothetical protein [Bacillota bacterium]